MFGNNSRKDLILLVDDESDLLESCVRILEDEDLRCITTTDSTKAIEITRSERPTVVVTDYLMPGKTGMEVLQEILAEFPHIPVIMFSAFATINGVVDAVKTGAFDYLTKPFSSDQLIIAVKRALEQSKLRDENRLLKERLRTEYFNRYFVGKEPKFLKTVEIIEKVAATESNALITGEIGTGKELAARSIHLNSRRGDGPFVVIDCSSAVEIFGSSHAGQEGDIGTILAGAEGGTLYLENVHELDQQSQSRLVRALQDMKKSSEIGSAPSGKIAGVRLIASTEVDLSEETAQGRFRENLFYFLNVVRIDLPPLRDRREDIGMLCEHFFKEMTKGDGKKPFSMQPDALARLMEYDWPGNVRELRNVLEMAVSITEEGSVTLKNLPDEIKSIAGGKHVPMKEARKSWLDKFEKSYLENLLLAHKGNISRASEEAGIARMSLYRMLKRTGLEQLVIAERSSEKREADGDEKIRTEK